MTTPAMKTFSPCFRFARSADWTEAALNRVDRPAFFKNFVESHAVQYFYEPFLEAFDPELRKDLGVWYTPPEIVEYMVARVDTVLRTELGIADGLADPRVVVLDPCCGTGAYLVEVLKRINRTLNEEQGLGQMAQLYTKKAAQERIFGFELLPAPFVVAHLQLGLLLQNFGVPLDDDKSERAAIYLTNALNGWEPPKEPKQKLLFEEFQQERDAADKVKQQAPIIVILGNPPYNGFASLAVEEERDLSNAYRTTKKAPAPQGQGLNDLYVRFFRMAERRIIEKSGEGVVCFISNYSWLDGLSFTGMRERYLEAFDSITVDCLNGDKYKTGKLTPDGDPDPSVFSTESNREGIQVGTAIAMLVRKPKHKAGDVVHFRHLWGKEKRAELLKSLGESSVNPYEALQPPLEVGLPFLPAKVELDFFAWPLLTELLPVSFPGVKTSRDDFLIAVDRQALDSRLEKYFDPNISHEEMRQIAPTVMEKSASFRAENVRDELRSRGVLKDNFVRYCYRPFDVRWLYWEPETNLLDRNRAEYFPQIFEGNLWLEARQKQPMDVFDRGYFSRVLSDNFGNGLSNYFPLLLKSTHDGSSLFGGTVDDKPQSNLSDGANKYLASHDSEKSPELLFFHILAVLHSPVYRVENSGALRQDWPRIPLPQSRDVLRLSADLGRQVAALLDTEKSVPGVTQGKPSQDLKGIAELHWPGEPDFKITAGWGHAGKGGVTMPGRGKLVEQADSAKAFPVILGKKAYDIYLNDTACWENVPEKVWEYTIGGYQVIKKWLSYREHDLLGRALAPDEAREVTNMARRIAALILLQPELDKNYETIKAKTTAWSGWKAAL
jgi:predicted helicase